MDQPLILNRYRPLAELGEGGHGSVTLAYDTRMARRVAVKRLPLPLSTEEGRSPRSIGLAEARTAAMLAHPNVVTVFEWDTDADEAFLVMEYVEGATLADVTEAAGGRLGHGEAAAVVRAVAAALSHAHANGVLHLDIKPDNVLITRDGMVKVADFGIAELTDSGGRAHTPAGTPGYMPPEQLAGEELDAASDQWALAALAYELLTGANPFASRSVEGALFKARFAQVPAPSEFDRSISPDIDDTLLVALAPEPEARFETVDAFAGELLPLLGDAEEGAEELAEIVRGILGEEVEEEYEGLGLWDRLAAYAGVGRRTAAAGLCAWVTWAALGPLVSQAAPRAGGAALVALAAALAPALGIALAVLALSIAAGAASLLGGLVVFAVGAAFWALVARRGGADGLAPLAAPAFAFVRAGFALPLLLGFEFPPVRAAASAAFASLAVSAAAAVGDGGWPLLAVAPDMLLDPVGSAVPDGWRALLDPGVAIAALSWASAAGVCSAFSGRATRLSSAVGGGLGLGVILAAYGAWGAATGASAPDPLVLQQLAGSLILFGVVVAAGPPVRGEEG